MTTTNQDQQNSHTFTRGTDVKDFTFDFIIQDSTETNIQMSYYSCDESNTQFVSNLYRLWVYF